MKKPIKVLIVDDSALVRQTLVDLLGSDPEIVVMGTASDPFVAARRMQAETPDVITLDVEMPRMDGITFLRRLMAQRPVPVVMCSSLTEEGSETLMQALEAGAVDVILKPRVGTAQFLQELRVRICEAVKAAAHARLHRLPTRSSPSPAPAAKLSADVMLPPPGQNHAMARTTERVICIGASTGGTESLRVVLETLPVASPGIVIVQHMPEKFTEAFARRLDGLCELEVKEAADGDAVLRGRALIAPGNHHLLLQRSGARYYVAVKDGPLVSRHRPSVDVLFRSAAHSLGANGVGIIMTGMGDDGAHGLLEMKQAGAMTIAQDEATSVVFGMPREAIALGAADKVLPLDRLAPEIVPGGQMTVAIFLSPGDLYSGAEPAVVSTILGSCVAVCLWDRVGGRGGMNHFLLPRSGSSPPTPRYGDVAVSRLVEEMERLGCCPANLGAKVFGGATVLPFGLQSETVGSQNVGAALELLRFHRIPVLTRRTGGQRGLLIRFHTRMGWVMVRELTPGSAEALAPASAAC